MKFLCVTQFFPPSVGGMQMSNYLLVKGFKKLGLDVCLVVFSNFSESIIDDIDCKIIHYRFSLNKVRNQIKCAKSILNHSRDFGATHILLLDDGVVRALGFLPMFCKPKLKIVSVNSGSTLTRINKHFRGKVNSFFVNRGYRWLEKIFVSKSTYDDLIALPGFANRVKMIGRPIPDEYYVEYKNISISNIKKDLPILFSCCRAEQSKGVSIILCALAKLQKRKFKQKFKFIHAGDGPALESWKKLAVDLKLEEVYFLGNVPFSQLSSYYQKSYMCIFASKSETFGRTWVEAFASGKPVISTAMTNLKHLVIDNKNSIIIEPNVNSVSRGIEKALTMSSLEYDRLSGNAITMASEFKQSIIVEKILTEIE